ncbi:DUF1642 domain-containing protein [Lactiplantibacillus plantarum]|uniref:DUF1642 domain-containing protein n=1 Tax=Lactiplantibacillus plantarum TaxID=1590 RepID=UPI0024B99866|nr:DUF1642 domain-containing protein [Lactiplantibacillus plantarum]WHQ52367.1 DUF1642 domain-containing protein [Lactiplantibacillus plantarum]
MKNETKRDVFDDALVYVPVGREYDPVNDDEAGDLRSFLSARYAAALPDDLPVIPKEIDEHIRWCKGEGGVGNVSDAMDYAHGDVASWIYDERNSDTFARAWLDGYVVEVDE